MTIGKGYEQSRATPISSSLSPYGSEYEQRSFVCEHTLNATQRHLSVPRSSAKYLVGRRPPRTTRPLTSKPYVPKQISSMIALLIFQRRISFAGYSGQCHLSRMVKISRSTISKQHMKWLSILLIVLTMMCSCRTKKQVVTTTAFSAGTIRYTLRDSLGAILPFTLPWFSQNNSGAQLNRSHDHADSMSNAHSSTGTQQRTAQMTNANIPYALQIDFGIQHTDTTISQKAPTAEPTAPTLRARMRACCSALLVIACLFLIVTIIVRLGKVIKTLL